MGTMVMLSVAYNFYGNVLGALKSPSVEKVKHDPGTDWSFICVTWLYDFICTVNF